MATFDYDLFVIGAGSGGVRAARMASASGARVAVAEGRFLGGTCVNVGCVPKKLFVYGSHFAESFEESKGFGWQLGDFKFEWSTLLANKNREIERLNGIYQNILESSGVTIVDGYAVFCGPNEVEVNGKRITAERILIAVGGKPFLPEMPGKEFIKTSDDMFYLEALPKKAIVVGGGYIAIEFAGILNGLGVETHLYYRGDAILRGFDGDVRNFVSEEVQKKGIKLHLNTNISSIARSSESVDSELLVSHDDGSQLDVDLVMYATGRVPLVDGLGLANINVAQKTNGAIMVNDDYQTSEPSVFALGDVIDRVQLTPVALAEAMYFVKKFYSDNPAEAQPLNYDLIATAVFSQPNIGTVGLSEEAARDKFESIKIFRSDFKHMKHSLSGSDERTLMKIIVDAGTDKILGLHVVGADAGEIIQGFSVALNMGVTKAQFDSTIGIHPTAAEELVTMREAVT